MDIFNQPTVAHFPPQRYTALNSTVAKALQECSFVSSACTGARAEVYERAEYSCEGTGGAGQAFSATARAPAAHSALCCQYGAESNICGLRWTWEVRVPEVGRTRSSFRPRRSRPSAHVVILNDAAWSIVEAQRRVHPDYVFAYRRKPIHSMNNTAWQNTKKRSVSRKCASMIYAIIRDKTPSSRCRRRKPAALLGHATLVDHKPLCQR